MKICLPCIFEVVSLLDLDCVDTDGTVISMNFFITEI